MDPDESIPFAFKATRKRANLPPEQSVIFSFTSFKKKEMDRFVSYGLGRESSFLPVAPFVSYMVPMGKRKSDNGDARATANKVARSELNTFSATDTAGGDDDLKKHAMLEHGLNPNALVMPSIHDGVDPLLNAKEDTSPESNARRPSFEGSSWYL